MGRWGGGAVGRLIWMWVVGRSTGVTVGDGAVGPYCTLIERSSEADAKELVSLALNLIIIT